MEKGSVIAQLIISVVGGLIVNAIVYFCKHLELINMLPNIESWSGWIFQIVVFIITFVGLFLGLRHWAKSNKKLVYSDGSNLQKKIRDVLNKDEDKDYNLEKEIGKLLKKVDKDK